MWLNAVRRYLRGGHLLGRSLVLHDIYQAGHAQFIDAAVQTGLLQALRSPKTRAELIEELDVKREELLDGLLDLGVSWRELRERDGRFSIRGRRSKALVTEIGDPYAAALHESQWYHGSVYGELGARMRGAPLGAYMESSGELVARSSRVGAPPASAFLDRVLRREGPKTMLDVGCGSGIYLRQAVTTRDGMTATGVDYSPEAAAHARDNVARWGLEDRVRVVTGDVRDRTLDIEPADLVTLFQNLYYFEPNEWVPLFERLRELTDDGGILALICLFAARKRIAAHLDLILQSTKDNFPMPHLDEAVAALEAAGYVVDRPKRLFPGQPMYGLLARPPR